MIRMHLDIIRDTRQQHRGVNNQIIEHREGGGDGGVDDGNNPYHHDGALVQLRGPELGQRFADMLVDVAHGGVVGVPVVLIDPVGNGFVRAEREGSACSEEYEYVATRSKHRGKSKGSADI